MGANTSGDCAHPHNVFRQEEQSNVPDTECLNDFHLIPGLSTGKIAGLLTLEEALLER